MAFACFKCFAPKEIGLPSAAYKMAGVWQNTTTENYGVWLREYLVLPMAKALIAERLVQNPTFEVREGGKKLHCTTNCRMAIPVEEDLIEGESTLEEPNLSMTYAVQGFWEGEGDTAKFVTRRVTPLLNEGKPNTMKRWVDPATGELVITQDWGTGKVFTARFERSEDSANIIVSPAPPTGSKAGLW